MSHPESTDQDPNNALNPESTPEVTDDSNSGVDQYFDADERLVEMAAKLKAAETEVLKSHAEAENFRKRLQRDAEQSLRYANMPLVRDLLDVIDNLKRATDLGRRRCSRHRVAQRRADGESTIGRHPGQVRLQAN